MRGTAAPALASLHNLTLSVRSFAPVLFPFRDFLNSSCWTRLYHRRPLLVRDKPEGAPLLKLSRTARSNLASRCHFLTFAPDRHRLLLQPSWRGLHLRAPVLLSRLMNTRAFSADFNTGPAQPSTHPHLTKPIIAACPHPPVRFPAGLDPPGQQPPRRALSARRGGQSAEGVRDAAEARARDGRQRALLLLCRRRRRC